MWLIVYSNDHAPLTVRPIYSSLKLRTAQMMIFSLVAMIGLEKCCITSACLQWLCHSGERTLAHGPLVSGTLLLNTILYLTILKLDEICLLFSNIMKLIYNTGFVLRGLDSLGSFSDSFDKGETFVTSCWLSYTHIPFWKGSTLKWKNLLT